MQILGGEVTWWSEREDVSSSIAQDRFFSFFFFELEITFLIFFC